MNTLLDYRELMKSIEELLVRIHERFPDSVLVTTCRSFRDIALGFEEDVRRIHRPNWLIRGISAVFILIALLALVYAVMSLNIEVRKFSFAELIQLADAALNDIFIMGATALFMVSIETRLKRNRIISVVNRLRSLAHVIDMHQLTKDPTVVTSGMTVTEHSPKRTMTPYELSRYLDYCSEMLALTSKLGFSYVQGFDDAEAVGAVNELENLTTALARKIWQKIMLIRPDEPAGQAGNP